MDNGYGTETSNLRLGEYQVVSQLQSQSSLASPLESEQVILVHNMFCPEFLEEKNELRWGSVSNICRLIQVYFSFKTTASILKLLKDKIGGPLCRPISSPRKQ